MTAYIGRIQDSDGADVYPQVMTEGIIGINDYALKKDVLNLSGINDTGWKDNGLTFVNGAYNQSNPNSSDKHSKYRMITIGNIKLVMLNFMFAFNKTVSSNFIQAVKLPESIAMANGAQHYIKTETHNGVLLRFSSTSLEVKASPDLTEGRTIYFETMYIC